MSDTDKITADMVGCWLDGAQGWHNSYRVVDTAVNYGMPLDDNDRAILDAYRQGDSGDITLSDGETVNVAECVTGQGELADKATEYLQERAPAGYVFYWDAGDLSLVSETEID